MKSYLNRDEKKIVLVLASFASYLEKLMVTLVECKKPKKMIKWGRSARTFTLKTMDELMVGLDQNHVKAIIKEIDSMVLVAKYSDNAVREYKEMKDLDSMTQIETGEFLDICCQAIEVCKFCGNVQKECGLRKILLKHSVEPVNYEAGNDECPYKELNVEPISI